MALFTMKYSAFNQKRNKFIDVFISGMFAGLKFCLIDHLISNSKKKTFKNLIEKNGSALFIHRRTDG